jgi:23S rRNA (guanosine2251-2'-O)-methyltransferase
MTEEWAYGLHAVEGLLRREPQRARELLLQRGRQDRRTAALKRLAEAAGVPLTLADRRTLDEAVDGRHQGVLLRLTAAEPDSDLRWSEAQLQAAAEAHPDILLLVLDGVTDPHNLGACLRSADAAGVCRGDPQGQRGGYHRRGAQGRLRGNGQRAAGAGDQPRAHPGCA